MTETPKFIQCTLNLVQDKTLRTRTACTGTPTPRVLDPGTLGSGGRQRTDHSKLTPQGFSLLINFCNPHVYIKW